MVMTKQILCYKCVINVYKDNETCMNNYFSESYLNTYYIIHIHNKLQSE